MQTLINSLKTQIPISKLVYGSQKQLIAIRLSYEIENTEKALLQIFNCKNRDQEIVEQAIRIANKDQFDNKELVKNIRISLHQYKQQIKDLQRKYYLKIGLLGYGILFAIHIGVQGWFYLEYDLWISCPSLSDYHVNRFR